MPITQRSEDQHNTPSTPQLDLAKAGSTVGRGNFGRAVAHAFHARADETNPRHPAVPVAEVLARTKPVSVAGRTVGVPGIGVGVGIARLGRPSSTAGDAVLSRSARSVATSKKSKSKKAKRHFTFRDLRGADSATAGRRQVAKSLAGGSTVAGALAQGFAAYRNAGGRKSHWSFTTWALGKSFRGLP